MSIKELLKTRTPESLIGEILWRTANEAIRSYGFEDAHKYMK